MGKAPTFTDEEYSCFAESIESGAYFENAKKWYAAVYLSVLAERCLYIVLTAISLMAALFAIVGLLQLLPVKPTEPLLFPMKNLIRDAPTIFELRDSPYQPVNDALQRFFVSAYVERRENYSFEKIQSQFRYLKGYSSKEELQAYSRYINPSSPRSPINRYQKKIERKVDVGKVSIRREDGQPMNWDEDARFIADVSFKASEIHPFTVQLSDWTAQVVFDYEQLTVTQPDYDESDKAEVRPMKFTVVDYSVIDESS